MTTVERARRIVEAILKSHNGRKGLQNAWDAIDDEIQDEIIAEWEHLVREALEQTSGSEPATPRSA